MFASKCTFSTSPRAYICLEVRLEVHIGSISRASVGCSEAMVVADWDERRSLQVLTRPDCGQLWTQYTHSTIIHFVQYNLVYTMRLRKRLNCELRYGLVSDTKQLIESTQNHHRPSSSLSAPKGSPAIAIAGSTPPLLELVLPTIAPWTDSSASVHFSRAA